MNIRESYIPSTDDVRAYELENKNIHQLYNWKEKINNYKDKISAEDRSEILDPEYGERNEKTNI